MAQCERWHSSPGERHSFQYISKVSATQRETCHLTLHCYPVGVFPATNADTITSSCSFSFTLSFHFLVLVEGQHRVQNAVEIQQISTGLVKAHNLTAEWKQQARHRAICASAGQSNTNTGRWCSFITTGPPASVSCSCSAFLQLLLFFLSPPSPTRTHSFVGLVVISVLNHLL